MKKIEGTYATAIVYTDLIENAAARQIQTLCSQPFADGSRIRTMPDVHAGAGCVIGFTDDLGELVIPSTLDECPMAYKHMESIRANVEPTVEIQKIIRPVYNFKAGEMPEP